MIESNAPPLYTVFRPSDRLIIVDLPGGDAARLSPNYAVKSAHVDSIAVRQSRVGGTTSERAVTRLEIAVKGEVRDRSLIDGNMLVLELSSAPQSNQAKAAAADQPGLVEAKERRKESNAKESNAKESNAAGQSGPSVYVNPVPVSAAAKLPATDRAQAPQAALKPASLVQSVRSELVEGGVRILVDTDGAAQFKDFVLPDPWRVVVDITGVASAFGNKTFTVGGLLRRPRARGTAFGWCRPRSRRHSLEALLPRYARRVARRHRGRKPERDAVGQNPPRSPSRLRLLIARSKWRGSASRIKNPRIRKPRIRKPRIRKKRPARIFLLTSSPRRASPLRRGRARVGRARVGRARADRISVSPRSRTRDCRCPRSLPRQTRLR